MTTLKRLLIIFITVGLCACSNSNQETKADQASNSSKPPVEEIEPLNADQYMFTDLNGKGINIEDYAGKRVFVNFWATWCKPCIEEMPDLKQLEETLGDDYVFLFASDQGIGKIRAFANEKDLDLKFVHLNKSLQGDLKVNALPTTFIYDTKGMRRKTITGAMKNWNAPKMIESLKSVQ